MRDAMTSISIEAVSGANAPLEKLALETYVPPAKPSLVGLSRAEIAEQLGWRLPQHTVVPMASGSLLTKIQKGYQEFLRLGLAPESRFAIHVLKVALLFSAQRYVDHTKKENRIVDLEAVKEAIALVERTMQEAVPLIEETEANPYQRMQLRVIAYLTEHKTITRKQLLQNLHLTASEATAIVSDLYQAERLFTQNGAPNFGLRERYSATKKMSKKGNAQDED